MIVPIIMNNYPKERMVAKPKKKWVSHSILKSADRGDVLGFFSFATTYMFLGESCSYDDVQ